MNPKANTNTTGASAGLRDPLKDFAPPTPPLHANARLILLALLALVVIIGVARLRRTDTRDAEYVPRRDMAGLLALIWAGLGVEWIRSRFDLATPGFWLASLALIPFLAGVVALGARLFLAYRRGTAIPPPVPPAPRTGRK